jgi:hypothetical protein
VQYSVLPVMYQLSGQLLFDVDCCCCFCLIAVVAMVLCLIPFLCLLPMFLSCSLCSLCGFFCAVFCTQVLC